ncbi:tetratricopeptide repeat protein [Polaribacter sp.]|uniref:tetratricopeptide repeat protein n=1 Tax=Polaribacter sp. TaxID=1920175 RepID=UPI003F6CA241
MKKILVIVIFFVCSIVNAQQKIPFIDYNEIQPQIEQAVEQKAYAEALSLANKINKNDSIYFSVLSSKSYYLLQLKKFDEAIQVADEGIQEDHTQSKVFFYINKAVALTNLKKYNEALKTYNEAIQIYPKNYILWFNKGEVLEQQNKLNKALVAYKEAILLNPLFGKPHLKIGNIFYNQEKLTQALMAFNMYLLLNSNELGSFEAIKDVNNKAALLTPFKKNEAINLVEDKNTFKEIDSILISKESIKLSYKTNNEIELALVNQNHIMMQNLRNFSGDETFWTQKYVSFYKWIVENNYFDHFIYTILFATQNQQHKKIIENNTDKIAAFFEPYQEKWQNIISKNIVDFNGEKQEVYYEYIGGILSAIGKKVDHKVVGVWNFYDEHGKLATKGSFDEYQKKSGKWIWYNHLGDVKEIANYKDDALNGKNIMYYDNGKINISLSFKNNNIDGKYEYYTSNGALSQRKYYKDGLLDGVFKSYFKVGEDLLEFKIPYEKDRIEGEAIEYYANGSIYSKSDYINGVLSGKKTIYYPNAKVSSVTEYFNSARNGVYKSYHPNGQLYENGQSVKAFYDGGWQMFYANGVLQSEFDYKKGKLHNIYIANDTDGKPHYDYFYENGEITAYTYYKKDGSVLDKGVKKDTLLNYKSYSPQGILTSKGIYNNLGQKTGFWKFYDDHGVLKSECYFIENDKDGDEVAFHKNGAIESITPYKLGVLHGYYAAYYKNKQLSAQGWYKNGYQFGEWRYYYKDGTLQSINFFNRGQLHGKQQYFDVKGRLNNTTHLEYGNLISEENFDEKGIPKGTIKYASNKKVNTITLHHTNGKPKAIITYTNEIKHGSFTEYYFNRNKKVEGTYNNGDQHGNWTWFFDSGEVQTKATYVNGNLNGKEETFYKNGQLASVSVYRNGNKIDKSISYFNDGVLQISTEFFNGKQHGRKEFYEPTGKLQLVRFYNYGKLIGYSYKDKNNVELPMIPLKNETGKIDAFYSNGKPSKTMEYKNGDLVNSYTSYFYNGFKQDEFTYKDDEIVGVRKEYFTNGKIKNEQSFKNGERNGKYIRYYKNGKKKEVSNYINNVLYGTSLFYDENEKLILKKNYVNGTLMRVENI